MSTKKGNKMASIIGYRIKVTLNDSRTLAGYMLAFDKHMNLVISECEEFRRVKSKKNKTSLDTDEEEEMKRMLGLVILRGETIVTLSVEGPPPTETADLKSGPGLSAGPGIGAPAGRGMGLGVPTMRAAPQGIPPPNFGLPPGMVPPPGFGGPPPGFAPPPGFR